MTRDTKSSTVGTLTPAAAAKHAGCGRTTIMKALKANDLYATRDNRNRWKIGLDELEKWMENRPDTDATPSVSDGVTVATVTATADATQAFQDLAAAEATIDELRSLIARTDEHHATEIARLERIIERLTAPKPSILQRLLGADRSS